MRELLIATSNQGKYREISEALSGLNFRLVFLKDLNLDSADFMEDGKTFQENALKKAKYFSEKTEMITLADDSGIIVDALKDELGVKTRRWGAGEAASDEQWLEYFLKKMENISDEKRTAEFVCAVCIIVPQKTEKNFTGETKGMLTRKPESSLIPGIPLSSCFIPNGLKKVYAALTPAEKNKVSHRGKALFQAREYLEGI